jgi:hypothetical protein
MNLKKSQLGRKPRYMDFAHKRKGLWEIFVDRLCSDRLMMALAISFVQYADGLSVKLTELSVDKGLRVCPSERPFGSRPRMALWANKFTLAVHITKGCPETNYLHQVWQLRALELFERISKLAKTRSKSQWT